MRSLLKKFRTKWKLRRARRALESALALHRRGEIRNDGLALVDYSVKLTVSWRARGIHPWDRDMPEEKVAQRLVNQTMHDVEDALERIFHAFPEAITLDVNVFENVSDSDRIIMSGLVERSDLGRFPAASIAMRLRMLGINYHLADQQLETIGTGEVPTRLDPSRTDFELGRPVTRIRQASHLTIKSSMRGPEDDPR
jgi:hypothetical protein